MTNSSEAPFGNIGEENAAKLQQVKDAYLQAREGLLGQSV